MPDLAEQSAKLADAYAKQQGRDILLFSGPLDFGCQDQLHNAILSRKSRSKDLLLILATFGGDPHVAYRVGKILQRRYGHIQVLVDGWCKSAGTLVAMSGHEIIMGDLGELGPIDVQRLRPDDLWERSSGLTQDSAIAELADIAWGLFSTLAVKTKRLSVGHTFKTAAEVAAPLVSGMLSPVFAQMDPHHIGENSRAVKIARDYGIRLNMHSGNLREQGMDMLLKGYSSHEFVINREEARELLFRTVSEPSPDLSELCNAIGQPARLASDEKLDLRYINSEPKTTSDTKPKTNEELQHDGDETQQPDRQSARVSEDTEPTT